MSVKNEWPTANINFAVLIQKSVVIFLCRAIFLAKSGLFLNLKLPILYTEQPVVLGMGYNIIPVYHISINYLLNQC